MFGLFCFFLYVLVVIGLSIYGAHRIWMIITYLRVRSECQRPAGRFKTLPKVTVQLPVYNERYVVKRLIKAVIELDYPRHLLEVQILDDSTDDTSDIIAGELEAPEWCVARGVQGRSPAIRVGATGFGLYSDL